MQVFILLSHQFVFPLGNRHITFDDMEELIHRVADSYALDFHCSKEEAPAQLKAALTGVTKIEHCVTVSSDTVAPRKLYQRLVCAFGLHL